jgi:hypothetical protein
MDTASSQSVENLTVQGQAPAAKSHLWAGDHFSFHDLLDAINPLQHIPIVSTIYRAVTGDEPGNVARVVGDGLYGGVIGVVAGLLDVDVKETTGKDIGENVMSMLGLDDEDKAQDNKAQDDAAKTGDAAGPAADQPAAPSAPVPVPGQKPAVPQAQVPVAAAAAVPSGIPLAQAPAQMMPLQTGPKTMPLNNGKAHSFPIDTSPEGILALKTTSNSQPRAVPLNIPAGTLPPGQRIPQTGAEFAQRMQEGLDKYKAMMVARDAAASAGGGLDQVQ